MISSYLAVSKPTYKVTFLGVNCYHFYYLSNLFPFHAVEESEGK